MSLVLLALVALFFFWKWLEAEQRISAMLAEAEEAVKESQDVVEVGKRRRSK
jgi:hypothetical protein